MLCSSTRQAGRIFTRQYSRRLADVARPGARSLWDVAEACLAAAAFAVLCALVLRASPYLPEPDDYAYRASIVAMTDGHFFTLTGAQAPRSPSSWHLRWAATGWVLVRVAAPSSGCSCR